MKFANTSGVERIKKISNKLSQKFKAGFKTIF